MNTTQVVISVLTVGEVAGYLVRVVARRARRAEHGRRWDGPDLGQRDRRLRQLREHQLLFRAHLVAAAPAAYAVPR